MKIKPMITVRYDELRHCEDIVDLKEMETQGCYALLYKTITGKHFIMPERSRFDANLVLAEAGVSDAEYVSKGFVANDNAFIHAKSFMYIICKDGSEYDVIRNYDGYVCVLPHFAEVETVPISKQYMLKFGDLP